MKWKTQFFIPLVLLIFIIGVFNPLPGQCYTYYSFSQEKGDEYVYIVTISENPDTNTLLKKLIIYPSAKAVGDQIKIQIQKANTTLLSVINYDTLYGRIQKGSFNNSIWFTIASDYTLLAAYNSTFKWLVTPWSPLIIPRNCNVVNQTLCQMLQTCWNFTGLDWTSIYYFGEWSGWNGSLDGDLNQPKMSFKVSTEGMLVYWRIYNGTGSAWNLIYSLELLPNTLIPQAESEYLWKVTVSENPQINPLAPNVGDRLKIKILVNNGTFTPPVVHQTLYGLVFNWSTINPTWVPLTETVSLIAAYSYSDGIFINEWNPYFMPIDYGGIMDLLSVLLPWPPYTRYSWSMSGNADVSNGSGTGDLGDIWTSYGFTEDGVLLYWRFYTGTGDGWHLVYSLDLQTNSIPGYELSYIILGILVSIFLYVHANDRRYRKLPLTL